MHNSLKYTDQNLIWHPFTNQHEALNNLFITHGKDSYIYDDHGKAYLDLISSWWVNLHGHAHPLIAEAIYQQAKTLEHVMFAGFTHEPATLLCHKLSTLLPSTLNKFFYSDNGSTAVEVAIKMAYQFWYIQGQAQKTLFLCFENGYHGDTFGAMALGRSSGFHEPFHPFLFQVINIPFPATWDQDETIETKENQAYQALEQMLEQYHDQIAAMILEPLVQGSSGMQLCRPQFLNRIVKLLKEKQILVIFDEVMTGFGRTGRNFAFEYIDFTPDIICLSKGLSGGFLPLALTITATEIYEVFTQHHARYVFAHGHSYTANPLACAAAVCSLNLLLTPETQTQIQNITRYHQQGQHYLKQALPDKLKQFRQLGTISAFTSTEALIATTFKQHALEQGLILRPLGQHIYLIPPYCIREEQCAEAYQKISFILKH